MKSNCEYKDEHMQIAKLKKHKFMENWILAHCNETAATGLLYKIVNKAAGTHIFTWDYGKNHSNIKVRNNDEFDEWSQWYFIHHGEGKYEIVNRASKTHIFPWGVDHYSQCKVRVGGEFDSYSKWFLQPDGDYTRIFHRICHADLFTWDYGKHYSDVKIRDHKEYDDWSLWEFQPIDTYRITTSTSKLGPIPGDLEWINVDDHSGIVEEKIIENSGPNDMEACSGMTIVEEVTHQYECENSRTKHVFWEVNTHAEGGFGGMPGSWGFNIDLSFKKSEETIDITRHQERLDIKRHYEFTDMQKCMVPPFSKYRFLKKSYIQRSHDVEVPINVKIRVRADKVKLDGSISRGWADARSIITFLNHKHDTDGFLFEEADEITIKSKMNVKMNFTKIYQRIIFEPVN